MSSYRTLFAVIALAAAATAASQARAGTYANITIDGNFSDWANVPVAATAPANPSAPISITSLSVANDSTNVYFLLTFSQPTNPQSGAGTFLAVDSDNNGATGYNIFGNTAIGSNFGFENDYPFTQTASAFNSGGTAVNATYSASPFDVSTTQQEIAVPLIATETDTSAGGYTGLIFPTTFTFEFYSTDGSGDTIGPVEYTLADDVAAPEPTSMALLALAAVPLAARRRRRASRDV